MYNVMLVPITQLLFTSLILCSCFFYLHTVHNVMLLEGTPCIVGRCSCNIAIICVIGHEQTGIDAMQGLELENSTILFINENYMLILEAYSYSQTAQLCRAQDMMGRRHCL